MILERRFLALTGAALLAAGVACSGGFASKGELEARGRPSSEVTAQPAEAHGARPTDATRLLRELSLELRGAPPSEAELDAVAIAGRVDDGVVDAMLRSDAFLERVSVWHKALLWPNVDRFAVGARPLLASERGGVRSIGTFSPDPELLDAPKKHPHAVLFARNPRLGPVPCDDAVEYPPPADGGPQPTYTLVGRDKQRHAYAYYDPDGEALPYHDAAHCPNMCSSKTAAERPPGFELQPDMVHEMSEAGDDPTPDDLDPPGKHCPASHPYRLRNPCDNSFLGYWGSRLLVRAEGYRPVTHYWSHGQALKTCAGDALTRDVGTIIGDRCAMPAADADPTCGCGRNGAYCMPASSNVLARATSRAVGDLRRALDEEPLQIVRSVVARDDDYFDILTTRRSFATGPLAYYLGHQSATAPIDLAPVSPSSLPDIPYDDASWHEYARGEEHAGVLTTAAYLLRFPTLRSRVSQFRSQFMCHPFTPAVASFPGPDDACTREPNLAKRCGCLACHASIEPMGAWFGRWAERGAKYLPPSAFPAFDPECADPVRAQANPDRCKYYLTDALDPGSAHALGTLRGYLYRSDDDKKRIDEGPRGLVHAAIASGELESCTVETTWKELLGRAMTDDEVDARLPAIERDFDVHHRSYRELVRAITASSEFRDEGSGGRVLRRLDSDQLRASLLAATGFKWVAPRTVSDPNSPNGTTALPDADMIDVLSGTLGRANYDTTTSNALDPAITFTKLAGDAARSACRASVASDLKQGSASVRHILRFVEPADTASSNEAGVRRNLSYLALRFWGRSLGPADADLAPLLALFARASEAAAPSDAWRAVCIALASDPQFLTF